MSPRRRAGASWAFMGLACAALALAPSQAAGSTYWGQGVRGRVITVCFVGDALTARPARVAEVLSDLQHFERAAGIEFVDLGTCAPPTTTSTTLGPRDRFAGGIRVALQGIMGTLHGVTYTDTGVVPGQGCKMFRKADGTYDGGNEGISWSNSPNEAKGNRACLYNLRLGDDGPSAGATYLNHTLHEFGHALGLVHEHARTDTPACVPGGPGSDVRTFGGGVRLTAYDWQSVMHYQFGACTIGGESVVINGNYADTGPSAWDRLGLHILYPEQQRVAEFVGTTVVRTTDGLQLEAAWQVRGARTAAVAKAFRWKLSGVLFGTEPELDLALSAGVYTLRFQHRDFLDRSYSYSGIVRVLTPKNFIRKISGPRAVMLPLLH